MNAACIITACVTQDQQLKTNIQAKSIGSMSKHDSFRFSSANIRKRLVAYWLIQTTWTTEKWQENNARSEVLWHELHEIFCQIIFQKLASKK